MFKRLVKQTMSITALSAVLIVGAIVTAQPTEARVSLSYGYHGLNLNLGHHYRP